MGNLSGDIQELKEDMQELKDCIAYGIVSNVNKEDMTARVEIADQGIISGNLKIVQRGRPWFPETGQYVLCIFIPDGDGDGFILGGI